MSKATDPQEINNDETLIAELVTLLDLALANVDPKSNIERIYGKRFDYAMTVARGSR